jgi:solute:Na+ symporter, SSS family
LRKASLIRNHCSPCDFITDRCQSQILRYTVATVQVVASVIYVSAQVVSLRTSFNSLFDIDPSSPWAVVIIFSFILVFEWVGGLASDALTDCIQGFTMAFSFIMTAIVIKKNFGGWTDLYPQTYLKPQFYQTPTGEQQWNFWQSTLLNFSFFALPHLIQRIYAAKDLRSLKVAFHVMNVGPWSSQLVSIFLGTVGVQFLKGEGGTSPFASIIETMMNLGGFPEAVGVIAYTASLAAIMSTADSLIIAISQLITVEFIYPMIPTATPKQITWYGRGVPFVVVVIALVICVHWQSGISDLAQLQFPITTMVVPPFLFGLFASGRYDVHPWSLSIGTTVATVYIFIIYFS